MDNLLDTGNVYRCETMKQHAGGGHTVELLLLSHRVSSPQELSFYIPAAAPLPYQLGQLYQLAFISLPKDH